MAWVAEEPFNNASDTGLDGSSGGSGWSVAWGGAGTIKSNESEFKLDTTVVLEGNRSCHIDCASVGAYIERLLTTAVTAGTVYFALRAAQTDATFHVILCEGSGASRMGVELSSDGNIKMLRSTGWSTLQAYSANTWYRFAIDFDDGGANPNSSRVRIDNGAYSSWQLVSSSNFTNISCVQLEHTAAVGKDFYLDYLTATDFYQSFSGTETENMNDPGSALDGSIYNKHLPSVTDTENMSDDDDTRYAWGTQTKSSTTWTNLPKS